MRVEGRAEPFKDAKLWPGGGREWDWDETGTSHEPGVQPADLTEILDHGADEIVIGTGVYGRMKVSDRARELLDGRGVKVHVLKTNDAVARYNELREKSRIGGLFHTTC